MKWGHPWTRARATYCCPYCGGVWRLREAFSVHRCREHRGKKVRK